MKKKEKAVLCVLHSINGIGHRSLHKIKDEFKSFEKCFYSNRAGLSNSFLNEGIIDNIINIRHRKDPLAFLEGIESRGIKVVTIYESNYPEALRYIANPPALFYSRGDIGIYQNFCIAVVGSRAATEYGKNVAYNLGKSLADYNITVVSGMARGIDRQAHEGALENNGKTIAVLGSGIDIIYPRENKMLYKDICQKGLAISDFSPGSRPEAGNFPMRNRIISGLSRGVVVVEAGLRSGALITADLALEQGKDVFAVPGSIRSRASAGANNLIKQGAIMLSGIGDIIEEYPNLMSRPVPPDLKQEKLAMLDDKESVIIESINDEPCHFDNLLKITGFDVGQLSSILLDLELKGIVKLIPGNYYVKIY